MNSFDNAVFHFLNQFAGHIPILDGIFSFLAQYALEIYAVLFVIAWFSLPRADEARRHALIVSGFTGILALLFNVLISNAWYRHRPFTVLPHGTYTQLIPHVDDASFPSDHSSGSFAFAAASWGKLPRLISYTFTILAVLVAVARVYSGVHWPTDVLASFVVGYIANLVMWKASKLLAPITNIGLKLFHYGRYHKHSKSKEA